MDIGLYIAAAALVLLSVLLLHGLSVARALGERFALLDREQQIPRLRRVFAASSALALACAAVVLALAVLNPGSKDDHSVARAGDSETPPAAAPAIEPPAVTEPVAQAFTPEPPPARPASESAPQSRPLAPASAATSPIPDTWRAARVVSNGEVTLRAWPNGTALTVLAPGERVFTRGERRDGGGHTWEKVRLPDGTNGWMVSRFVVAE